MIDRRHTRWTRPAGTHMVADILGAPYELVVSPTLGTVTLTPETVESLADMNPDEARLLGVRLIEGAALADGNRAIRDTCGGSNG